MSYSLKASSSSDGGVISTEVTPSPKQRRYATAFKLHKLEEASQCTAPGVIASMLRREGIYFSILSDFRKQKARGLLDTSSTKRERNEQANCTALRELSVPRQAWEAGMTAMMRLAERSARPTFTTRQRSSRTMHPAN